MNQRTAEAGSALDDSRPSFLTIQVASSPEEITYHSYKITLVVDDEDLSTPPKTVDAALPEYTGSDDYAMLLAAALEDLGVAARRDPPTSARFKGEESTCTQLNLPVPYTVVDVKVERMGTTGLELEKGTLWVWVNGDGFSDAD